MTTRYGIFDAYAREAVSAPPNQNLLPAFILFLWLWQTGSDAVFCRLRARFCFCILFPYFLFSSAMASASIGAQPPPSALYMRTTSEVICPSLIA